MSVADDVRDERECDTSIKPFRGGCGRTPQLSLGRVAHIGLTRQETRLALRIRFTDGIEPCAQPSKMEARERRRSEEWRYDESSSRVQSSEHLLQTPIIAEDSRQPCTPQSLSLEPQRSAVTRPAGGGDDHELQGEVAVVLTNEITRRMKRSPILRWANLGEPS